VLEIGVNTTARSSGVAAQRHDQNRLGDKRLAAEPEQLAAGIPTYVLLHGEQVQML
jgi:hypothetical protein